ncbi:MAG: hypothetical protein ACRBBR_14845 [Cellvibrionaceae bacterium]
MSTSTHLPSGSMADNPSPKKTNGWKIFGITIIVLALIIGGGWLLKQYFFPSEFTPVSLSSKEARTLNEKLTQLNLPTLEASDNDTNPSVNGQTLEPEPYSEINASREITFSEREVNAMVAHNTDLADKLAIDLSDNLASAKLLMPLDPDMPLFGGKTLNLKAGIELAFNDGKPIVKLRGVSAWGVPVPNAWMGNIKNVDLVNEFGGNGGFWQSFAEGIDFMKVSEGQLVIKLKE